MSDSPHQSFRDSRALWLGIFFSPVVWSIYHVVGYALVEAACETTFLGFDIAGVSALLVVELALTVIVLLIMGWNAVWSYRSWRHYAAEDPAEEFPLQAYDRDEFMALSGLLLSATFILTILLTAYPFFVLNPCG
jgi:hypothetical protein